MIIKKSTELFTRLGIITQYNTLINQLTKLGFNLDNLATSEYYGADLFETFEETGIDEYNQEYTYGCLGELKSAFEQKTGAKLRLILNCGTGYWEVEKFYILVKNPNIKNINEDDLEESEYELC